LSKAALEQRLFSAKRLQIDLSQLPFGSVSVLLPFSIALCSLRLLRLRHFMAWRISLFI